MKNIDFVLSKIEEGKELAKRKTTTGKKDFPKRNLFVHIKRDIDDFLKNGNNRLITLYGLRGVGKTTLLFHLYRYLTEEKDFSRDEVLYLSLDEVVDFFDGDLYTLITSYLENIHETGIVDLDKKIFIFLDEAHFDEDWSKVAKLIYDKTENIFLIATGSSALSLSMSTDTARRSKEVQMFPLNFSEYLVLKHDTYPPGKTRRTIREVLFSPTGDNISRLNEKELSIRRELESLSKPKNIVFRNYLYYGGFAFGLHLEREEILKRTIDVIERMVRKDLPMIESFNQSSVSLITKVLSFVAMKRPGELSQAKLANRLDTSPAMVEKILEALVKSKMLFSVKPYGGAGKTVRKPWKYYFLTPTLKASICHMLGKLEERRENTGNLLETMVASYLFRMKERRENVQGIEYDPKDGGADFIIKRGDTEVPVEVGIGDKDKRQVKTTMRRCKNAEYGINVCDSEKTYMEDKVIFIPKETFSFL